MAKPLIETTVDVAFALDKLRDQQERQGFICEELLEQVKGALTLDPKSLLSIDWYMIYREFYAFAQHHLNSYFDRSTFLSLMKTKSDAYGDGPIRSWGHLGIVIRIDSKFQRYMNLVKNPHTNPGDEQTIDTLQDIIGYCVLGYLLAHKG